MYRHGLVETNWQLNRRARSIDAEWMSIGVEYSRATMSVLLVTSRFEGLPFRQYIDDLSAHDER